MNTLAILISDEARNALVGFPYQSGQFFSHEEANEVADVNQTWLYVELGEKDTTAAQEQFLNTKPNVIEWTIL